MGLTITTPPTAEPVTLDEAKAHLRVDGTAEDAYITALIQAARAWVESWTTRQLVQAEYRWQIDRFPHKSQEALRLPRAPVASVDSIEYVDGGGTTQTFTDYQADLAVEPGIILPDTNSQWPSVQTDKLNAVTVTFTAGYAPDDSQSPTDPAGNVPQGLKHAIMLLVGHWFEHRLSVGREGDAASMPQAVHFLCAPYRVVFF
jgi:uncharacterized phiE125 gp8 family phage protein